MFLLALMSNMVMTPHISKATPKSTIETNELRKFNALFITEICYNATATLPLNTVTPYNMRILAGSTYLVAVVPN